MTRRSPASSLGRNGAVTVERIYEPDETAMLAALREVLSWPRPENTDTQNGPRELTLPQAASNPAGVELETPQPARTER